VEYAPNFDDRLLEPTVLPAKVPNLLINGSSGIAVGMSTNVPPHNVKEVARAAIHLLEHPDCTVADLMGFVPGPDFPTGGLVVGTEGIRKAYETGRGRVVMQARVVKETKRGGREQLVVTEIPYATSKTRIIEQIADLTKRGKITDISDLRDESDRDGIRVVIELKRGADAARAFRQLLKWTALQATFGVISLALDGGVPKEFSLKEMLERFRDHRVEVVVRRSRWELGRAREEAHVLEGLLLALKHIDRVVAIIRSSRTRETAGAKLQKELQLTERQVEAILMMRLYRLTQLEGRELRERLGELEKRIRELEAILASPERQIAEIRRELEELLERYGDARRTRIVPTEQGLVLEDLIAQEDVAVTLSREGYIKQIPMSVYRRRLSTGRGLAGMDRYENDYVEHLFLASTADTLMFFTEDGQAYWLPVTEIPEAGSASRGRPVHPLLGLRKGERIVAVLSPSRQPEGAVLVFFTRQGMVKRTALDQYESQRAGGVIAVNLKSGDRLLDVQISNGSADLVLASRNGRVIRFPEAEVAEVGRVAQGVRGMKLSGADRLAGGVVLRRDATLCLVTEKGFVHSTPLAEFGVQRRDGLGVVAIALGAKTGKVVAAKELLPGDDLMVVASGGEAARLAGERIPLHSRGEPGEPLVPLQRGQSVLDVSRVAAREEPHAAGAAPAGDPDGDPEAGGVDEPLPDDEQYFLGVG
jgi:DNA gyrase subunit A